MVSEWYRDWYHNRLPGSVDPNLYSVSGTMNRDGTYSRVRRGGAWEDDGWAACAAADGCGMCRVVARMARLLRRSDSHAAK
jgi:hypothetical protein